MSTHQLNREAFEDLSHLIDHFNIVDEIMRCAAETDPNSTTRAFSRNVARSCGQHPEEVHQVLVSLSRLHRSTHVLGEKPKDLLESIGTQASEEGIWSKEVIAKWNELTPHLTAILSEISGDHPLFISAKAHHLTYLRQRVLHHSRIVTDVRPIFDSEAQTIREMIVTHSLVITYSEDDQTRETHLTLDARDIDELRNQCERALTKGKVIASAFQDQTWRTICVPEED